MTGEYERVAHDPVARSGMVLIDEDGTVQRVERVPNEAVDRASGDRYLGDPDGTPWIVLRVQP